MKNFFSFVTHKRLYLLPIILVFLMLVGIYGLKGTYSRYAQDDYCYGYRVRQDGFWSTQIQSYFHKAEYVSNRFSTTLAHSLTELLGGPHFVPVLVPLELAAWAAAMFYVFQLVLKRSSVQERLLVSIMASLAILFFSIYLATSQYQLFFWLSALHPYVTPMVLGTFLLGRLLSMSGRQGLKVWHFLEAALLAFLVGGFSETASICLFATWSVLFIGSLILRKRSSFFKHAAWLSLVEVAFLALALLLLAFSPANRTLEPLTKLDLPLILQNVIKGGFSFIRNALKVAPLPYLVVAGFGFWLGSLVQSISTRKPFHNLFNIMIILLVILLITFANMLPIKIARLPTSWPGARSFFPSQFGLVTGVFLIGWEFSNLLGSIKYRIVGIHPARVLQTVAGLALLAYGIHALPQAANKLELYRMRAQAWDTREQILFNELKAGQKEVVIPQFESVYNITELKPEADSWVNVCAARYYGADSITAQEDYMGIGTFPIGK